MRQIGQNLLINQPEYVDSLDVFGEGMEKGRRKVRISKVRKGYNAYGEMILHYAVKNIIRYLDKSEDNSIEKLNNMFEGKRLREWINLGGQMMPAEYVEQLRKDINEGALNTWDEIHHRYDELWENYQQEKLRHSYLSLLYLLQANEISHEAWNATLDKAVEIQQYICNQVYESRKKDYENPYRNATFRNEEEKIAVIGSIENNSFVKQIKEETEKFIAHVKEIKSN